MGKFEHKPGLAILIAEKAKKEAEADECQPDGQELLDAIKDEDPDKLIELLTALIKGIVADEECEDIDE